MLSYQQVFENNQIWAAKNKATNREFFEKLANDQSPDFLYIGCSDSRVVPEKLMGAEPGEVFVHRNIANVISAADQNTMSVIEFAVSQLKVRHIVVCGHYNCGGVAAAMERSDNGLLNPWLQNIKDVYRLHADELDSIIHQEDRYKRLIERNVEEQCFNIYKTAVVQKAIYSGYNPQIHGWVFDIKTGLLKDLNWDLDRKLYKIKNIYDLGMQK